MKNVEYFLVLIICLTIFLTILYNYKQFEYFNEQNCLDKNLICSISPSPLFPRKCFQITEEAIMPACYNTDCRSYPSCDKIAKICNMPELKKFGDGYVDLL